MFPGTSFIKVAVHKKKALDYTVCTQLLSPKCGKDVEKGGHFYVSFHFYLPQSFSDRGICEIAK